MTARRLKLRHLAAGVVRLSAMFTGRERFDPDYMRRPGLRHAYACYYAPIGAMKLAAILGELEQTGLRLGDGTVVDLGGGPGTGLLGLVLAGRRPSRFTLVDRVAACAEEARLFLECLETPVPFHYSTTPPKDADLALAMNVLGEPHDPPPLPRARAVIVMEPALKQNTQRLMAWRDRWVEEGWTVAAPCPVTARCPMRARPELWCHAEVGAPTLAVVEELGRRAGLRREALKFSYVVLTREAAAPGTFRLVSNRHTEKGKMWGWVCGAGEELVRVELLKRDRNEATRDFAMSRRGDVFAPLELDEKARVRAATRVARMVLR